MTPAPTIQTLDTEDFEAVDLLASKFKRTLGFLPRDAIQAYLRNGGVLGAKNDVGSLLGYVMFARYPDRIRIAQVCVNKSAHGQGIGRLLIEALKATVTTEKILKLKCRRDFEAHAFWAKIGFVAFDEVSGRSAEGHPLTAYSLVLDTDDKLALWKIQAAETTRHCVIDAQIFFDLYEQETTKSIPSKSLLNDFFADSLSLWITDELFVEIDRCPEQERRKISRDRAQGFQRIEHKTGLASNFENSLKQILPFKIPNQLSDIRQLAKAAASDAETFLTRDSRLLKNRENIKRLIGIEVSSPHEIILTLDREDKPAAYAPSFVSGLSLRWRKVSERVLESLPLQVFLQEGETLGIFKEQLNSLLAQPNRYRCEVLESDFKPVALRVLRIDELPKLPFALSRTTRSSQESLFASFVLADTLSYATTIGGELIVLPEPGSQSNLGLAAFQQKFRKHEWGLVKPVLPKSFTRNEVLDKLKKLLDSDYSDLEDLELENFASPLIVSDKIPSFLVAIKPCYARQMLDLVEAANELFEDKSPILLRTNNVYYKKKSAHRMLKGPGRILWYVSGKNARIIAISRLDEVEIGTPKTLFKKYSKFGALEWSDLFDLSRKELDREIMALRFSQTHSFRNSISRSQLKDICSENDFNLALPSPTKIPYKALQKIFTLGF